jgi:hypothetical protein
MLLQRHFARHHSLERDLTGRDGAPSSRPSHVCASARSDPCAPMKFTSQRASCTAGRFAGRPPIGDRSWGRVANPTRPVEAPRGREASAPPTRDVQGSTTRSAIPEQRGAVSTEASTARRGRWRSRAQNHLPDYLPGHSRRRPRSVHRSLRHARVPPRGRAQVPPRARGRRRAPVPPAPRRGITRTSRAVIGRAPCGP